MADDIRLDYFRESDKSVALMYVATYRERKARNPSFVPDARADAKPFNGGYTPEERELFDAVRAGYVDLLEASANYDNGNADFRRSMRGRYRYIFSIGRRTATDVDVVIGVARHPATARGALTWDNSFDHFVAFPRTLP